MIHHVFANRTNIGDLLSAEGLQQLLGVRPMEHLCDDPFVDDTLRRLHLLGPDDVVLVGGGGLVMDYFEDLWRGLDDERFTARLVLWGIGACDLKAESTWPDQELARRVAARAEVCVARDELTRAFLDVEAPPVPCPSLVRMPPARDAGAGLLHVNNHSTVGAAAYEVMRDIGLDYEQRTGLPFLETNNRIHHTGELAQAVGRYGRVSMVMSSALHGCVLAVAAGRPVLAVSGDWKIEAFMEAAGLGEWVLDAADVDRVPALLARLPEQPSVTGFAAQARLQNERVAEQVRLLIASSHRIVRSRADGPAA